MKRNFTFLMAAFALMVCMMMPQGVKGENRDVTTYTFTSKSWAATPANWTSGKDGYQMSSGRGVQVTKAYSGANATSPASFTGITKVSVTYSTNASAGAGTIKIQIGSNTEKSFTVTSSGGTTDRLATFDYTTPETGKVKLTVNCTTNSIYVKSVAITTGVNAPTFSPVAGTYVGTQNVTISSSTSGATIYYTTDGSTPTTSSAVYSSAIPVSTTQTTIKAIAVANGVSSTVASATFYIAAATPTFSPAAGTFTPGSAPDVTINCATSGVTIHYTTDGSTPTTSSAVYSSPIPVRETTTIKAIAVKSGLTNSSVASAEYVISSTLTATYTVRTTSSVTTSGTVPSGSSASFSQTYTTACQMTSGKSMTLTLSGYQGKKVTRLVLSMKSNTSGGRGYMYMDAGNTRLTSIGDPSNPNAEQPMFKDDDWYGAWSTSYVNITPTMSNNNYCIQQGENIVIYIKATANSLYCQSFTLYYEDDTEPKINVTDPEALAYNASSGTFDYSITNPVTGTSLQATSNTDWITNPQVSASQVTFNTTTNYTSEDRCGTITLTYGTVTKNVTITQGHLNVAAPTFSPAGGDYSAAQTVTISAVSGATIYYTINGNNPTTSSTVYSSPIQVSEYSVIKAIAVQNGVSSPVATATYNIVPVINIDQSSYSFPYTASSGSFNFSITNPVTGAIVSAAANVNWITPSVSDNTVNFQVAENTGLARTGIITLSCSLNGTTLATATVNIGQEANPNVPGSLNNPYTVAQALDIIEDLSSSDTTGWVYVKGIISRIKSVDVLQYNDANYYISNDGTTSDELYVYNGRFINNTDFLSEDEIQPGDSVVIYGRMMNYRGTTPELVRDNYIVFLYRDVHPVTFSPSSCVTISGTEVFLFSESYDEWDTQIFYTTDGTDPITSPTRIEFYAMDDDIIELESTITIKAVAYVPDLDKYSAVTQATYVIVDEDSPGWMENPYTVSQALAALDQNNNIRGAYVQGIISRIDQIETSQYFNATYFISDDGNPTNELKVYRGKYLSRADFTSQDDIKIGDHVIVFGDLTIYNSTVKEFKPQNYIWDFFRPSSIIISQNQLEFDCNSTSGIIDVSYSNDILVNINHPTFQFCDAQGNAASYDHSWLDVTLSEDTNWDLEYVISANPSDQARTAYLQVLCQDLVSNIVSITQSEYQIDFATLPFSFDGDHNAAANTVGLKPKYVESYSASPKLKFRNPTENGQTMVSSLVLKINEVPGVLSYDIRSYRSGTNSWSGTFTVQVSADGTTWHNHVEYQSNLTDNVRNEVINDLPVTTRYIRWIYTTRSGGNVALGNIHLAKPVIEYDIVCEQPFISGTQVGAIISSAATAFEGETIDLTVTPNDGYALVEWNVQDDNQEAVAVADPYATTTSFVMPASNVTVAASLVPSTTEYQYAYSVNGVEGESQVATVGTMLTLAAGSDISGLPFTFIGWSTNPNNVENVMSAGTTYRLTRDVTFYAVYVESVAGSSAVKQYVRVAEDLESNWAGDYLIAYSSDIFADGSVGGTDTDGIGHVGVSAEPGNNLHDNVVETVWGDLYRVTLEEVSAGSNTYLLKTQDGQYNYYSSNNNGLRATASRTVAAEYPITANFVSANDIRLSLGGNAEGAVFRYNPQGYFRFYKDCGQEPVYLYKKTLSTANRYTRVFVDNPSGSVTIAGPSIVPNGCVLNVSSITNTLGADRLVIEEGAQLVTSSNVNAKIKRTIIPYQGEFDNYYLISSPVDGQNPAEADMTNGEYDLYYFDQSQQREEWQNYEAHTFNLESGKGYLYANNYGGYINFSGAMTSAAEAVTIYNVSGKNHAGWNLIGNPYPCNVTIGKPYYRLAEGGAALATEATDENIAIAPMEGVFVHADQATESVSFTKAPNVSTTGGSKKLLAMKLRRNLGTKGGSLVEDNAIVRFGEGSLLHKLVLNPNNSQLYVTQDGTDYAIVNAEAEGELPVSFRAAEDGSYTITVEAEDMGMNYLHLIDNKTGADVNLLKTQSYIFDATTVDYASRFKLVFSTDSNATDATTDSFAYFNGSAWVVTGADAHAILQVIDMTGRVIVSKDAQAGVSTNEMAKGVYVLRLVSGDIVKTQKIVVK